MKGGFLVLRTTLLFGLGLSIGRCIARLLGKRQEPDELDGIVSESARLIAAWRALESLQDDCIITDQFALALSGPKAFQTALQTAQPFVSKDAAAQWRRKHKISNVAARVWWFDRQVLSALGAVHAEHAAAIAPHSSAPQQAGQPVQPASLPLVETPRLQPARPSHQNVVVLGSGMDTRPWRLLIPPGVHWYEVDMPDVVQAKRRVLQQLGIQLSKADERPQSNPDQGQLRCESWAAVEADLCSPLWTDRLVAAGFDPGLPTVWVAEGLLMYLRPGEGRSLLGAMAGASAPGSTLVMHNVTEELVQKLQQGPEVDYPPFSMELMKTWHFGLPSNPSQVLCEVGWQVEQAVSRAQIAREITGGLIEGMCDFETDIQKDRDRYTVFVVARK